MIMIALTGAHPSRFDTEGRIFKKDKYKTKGKPMKGYDSGYGSSYGSGYNSGTYGSYEGHGVTLISCKSINNVTITMFFFSNQGILLTCNHLKILEAN